MTNSSIVIDPAALLPVFERARVALAEAKSLDEAKLIRDQAQAIQAYLHQQRASLGLQNDAAEIKLRAERRLGEMLAASEKNNGGRPPENRSHDVTGFPVPPVYRDLGIEKMAAHRWQQVARLPEATFETYIAETKGKDELTTAGAIRLVQVMDRAERKHNPGPMPSGVYDVILADPPWQYDNSMDGWGAAELHYPAASIDEIKAIPVPSADNCTLFLWATNPFLREAMEVAQAWGFSYKTNLVWVKRGLTRPGSGFYVRGRHELLLICTKGSHVPDQTGKAPIGSVLEADIREHSRKPDEVYAIIEAMYPQAQYLELFARGTARKGWEVWGAEAS